MCLRLKAQYFPGTSKNPSALIRWNNLRPCIRVCVLTRAPIEITEQAQIEIGALSTTHVAVPNSCTAEIASGNDGRRQVDPTDWCRNRGINLFVVDHLSEQSGQQW
jgi:hypothetical protein